MGRKAFPAAPGRAPLTLKCVFEMRPFYFDPEPLSIERTVDELSQIQIANDFMAFTGFATGPAATHAKAPDSPPKPQIMQSAVVMPATTAATGSPAQQRKSAATVAAPTSGGLATATSTPGFTSIFAPVFPAVAAFPAPPAPAPTPAAPAIPPPAAVATAAVHPAPIAAGFPAAPRSIFETAELDKFLAGIKFENDELREAQEALTALGIYNLNRLRYAAKKKLLTREKLEQKGLRLVPAELLMEALEVGCGGWGKFVCRWIESEPPPLSTDTAPLDHDLLLIDPSLFTIPLTDLLLDSYALVIIPLTCMLVVHPQKFMPFFQQVHGFALQIGLKAE
jgi:hypothetical protein